MFLSDRLREFAFLRKIVKAAERQADATERIANILERDWAHKYIKPQIQRKIEFGEMDPDEVAKDYLRRLEAEQQGIDLEE